MSRWKYDVFLSHHSDDKPDVERLAAVLEQRGVTLWLDKWNLVVGDPWQPELEKALLASRTCAVFVGKHGLGPWQTQEMRVAIQRQVASRQTDQPFRVIPVLLPGATRGDRAKLGPAILRRRSCRAVLRPRRRGRLAVEQSAGHAIQGRADSVPGHPGRLGQRQIVGGSSRPDACIARGRAARQRRLAASHLPTR